MPPDLKMESRPSRWCERLCRMLVVQRAVSRSLVFCMVRTTAATIWGDCIRARRDASFLESWLTIMAALLTTTWGEEKPAGGRGSRWCPPQQGQAGSCSAGREPARGCRAWCWAGRRWSGRAGTAARARIAVFNNPHPRRSRSDAEGRSRGQHAVGSMKHRRAAGTGRGRAGGGQGAPRAGKKRSVPVQGQGRRAASEQQGRAAGRRGWAEVGSALSRGRGTRRALARGRSWTAATEPREDGSPAALLQLGKHVPQAPEVKAQRHAQVNHASLPGPHR